MPDRLVAALDPDSHEAILDDGSRLPFDLFLGIPVHRVPAVVEASGMVVRGWVPVDPRTAATRFPEVYAVGDVTSVGTPKAGVFAERAARVVADQLIARIRGEAEPPGYDGTGACWIEFGDHEVARVEVDFFSTPGRPLGTFTAPSALTAAEKAEFAAERYARWYGHLRRLTRRPARSGLCLGSALLACVIDRPLDVLDDAALLRRRLQAVNDGCATMLRQL